jgi:hypothetical protein
MKQCGFHWNKAPIAHFARSLFGNLLADSDQLFLPIDIFPPQDLATEPLSTRGDFCFLQCHPRWASRESALQRGGTRLYHSG